MRRSDERLREIERADLDRYLVQRQGLRGFTRVAWREVEPSRYLKNWHVDLIAEHLEAVTRRELSRLVINLPPGCMKSLSVSVMWPAYVWTKRPEEKWMFASYGAHLSRRDAGKMRALVASPWWQERFGPLPYVEARESVTDFANTKGGFRFSTSFDGGATGSHVDVQVADDPHKAQDVNGGGPTAQRALDEVLEAWRTTFASRLIDPERSGRVVVMQRLHERDLAGELINQGYTHLRLPMEFEPKACSHTRWGKDPRTSEGELLWPERFGENAVAVLQRENGPRGYATQYQQRPAPAGGTIFKREWFRYGVPPKGAAFVQSWDCRFKSAKDSGSFVTGQVWARHGANFYLVDQIRGRWGFNETLTAVEALARKWPQARAVLVEDKANGPAVVDALKAKVPGIQTVTPEGGKEARAHAVEPLFAAGQVFFPPPESTPWLADFEHELETFPNGANDDQVDAMTQALVYLRAKSRLGYVEALKMIRKELTP